MYGWTRAEALGRVSHELLRTQFPVPLARFEADLIGSGSWEGELVHAGRDGSQVLVASRWVVDRDERGEPRATLEINNDITGLPVAEEALRQSSAYNRRLIEASLEPPGHHRPLRHHHRRQRRPPRPSPAIPAPSSSARTSPIIHNPQDAREGYRGGLSGRASSVTTALEIRTRTGT